MNIGLMNDGSGKHYEVAGLRSLKTDSQGAERFADSFQNDVKRMDAAKSAKTANGGEAKNAYFRGAKGGIVEYNGVTFRCNYKTGALELGDCSRPYKCIRVSLEKGGSLLFNPDSISGLNQAISMFSAEDRGRIMRSIQLYNMTKDKLEELEEEENEDPKEASSTKDDDVEYESDGTEKDEITEDYVAVLRERTERYEIYDVA